MLLWCGAWQAQGLPLSEQLLYFWDAPCHSEATYIFSANVISKRSMNFWSLTSKSLSLFSSSPNSSTYFLITFVLTQSFCAPFTPFTPCGPAPLSWATYAQNWGSILSKNFFWSFVKWVGNEVWVVDIGFSATGEGENVGVIQDEWATIACHNITLVNALSWLKWQPWTLCTSDLNCLDPEINISKSILIGRFTLCVYFKSGALRGSGHAMRWREMGYREMLAVNVDRRLCHRQWHGPNKWGYQD